MPEFPKSRGFIGSTRLPIPIPLITHISVLKLKLILDPKDFIASIVQATSVPARRPSILLSPNDIDDNITHL